MLKKFKCCFFDSPKKSSTDYSKYDAGIVYSLGMDRKEKRNWKVAYECFKNGAERNHPGCMRELGEMFIEGIVVATDTKKGINLVEEAANAGDYKAKYFLALCYECGPPYVNKDHEKAMILMKEAAFGGESHAKGWLARKAREGNYDASLISEKLDIATFEKEGLQLLEKAANAGDSKAKYHLAMYYEYGSQYVARNHEKAMAFLKEAALSGDNLAKDWLMNEAGKGNEDAIKALESLNPQTFAPDRTNNPNHFVNQITVRSQGTNTDKIQVRQPTQFIVRGTTLYPVG